MDDAGTAKGAYRMRTGEKQIDHSLQVWIDIDETAQVELKQMVGDFCALLKQEVMYLERTDGAVEFIPPSTSEEGEPS